MKVFISACGEGFGHTSRMMALYKEFQNRGYETTVACYGSSLKRLQSFGLNTFETSPEARMVGEQGRFDLARSILATSRNPTDILKAYIRERNFIKSSGIDIVISDSRLSTVLAGTHSGKSTFLVSNQTSHSRTVEEGEKKLHGESLLSLGQINVKVLSKLLDVPLSLPFSYCDAVLIPDFKPPNTVCLSSLSRDVHIKKKTYITGPMSLLLYKKVEPAGWKTDKVKVLVTMGGQRFREGVLQKLSEKLRSLKSFEFIISSIFATEDIDMGNVKIRKYLPDVLPYMKSADMLVLPAGHSSIMESIILAKPSILIPDSNQFEQIDNALRYRELGLGEFVTLDKLNQIQAKLRRLDENYSKYKGRLERLARKARNGENGAKNAVEMIRDFYNRVNEY
ncbi:hypothetical protein HY570_03475 [Candidatus Micrarchaeota archaeon]|nr:hypothetical protein [Candidatus Micrarchaeota archaeon]